MLSRFNRTITWYNEHARYYVKKTLHKFGKENFELFTKHLKKGARVLDIGSGSGRDAQAFYLHGYNVIGLDISSGLIREARNRFPHIQFDIGSMLEMPYKEASFEGVWSYASLVHFETDSDIDRAIQECYRVLKQKGLLFISVKAQKGAKKTEMVVDEATQENRFFRYFTTKELESFLKKQKFSLVKKGQYIEKTRDPKGRDDVSWITMLAQKL